MKLALLKRDLLIAFRNLSDLAQRLIFFLLVVSLFPFGVGPEPATLREIAPGVIWVAALLASLLSLDTLFRNDFDDGSLEQTVITNPGLVLLSLAMLNKTIAHWLTTGLPLVILSPLLGTLLNMPAEAMITLMLSLLLGTPTLSFIGAAGAALTVGLRRASLLLSLLVLPLYIPVLIFGASAVQAAVAGLSASGQLYLLAAMLVLALTLAPVAIAAAVKVSLD